MGRAIGRWYVLVQPEMERWHFPLVSIPPFGRGSSRHRYDHQAITESLIAPRTDPYERVYAYGSYEG